MLQSEMLATVAAVVTAEYRRRRVPVTTTALSLRLMRGESTTRRYLVAAERAGLIVRVGQRGGWCPPEVYPSSVREGLRAQAESPSAAVSPG